ncbi:hypothetical protein PSTG_09188 [Puccinia striiformis f. sp. tritici PST-78]|uniref:Tc1-like transposase DDE domain-containing protein n=1 Tax=Puccinia striiformis f. sp. tritici PST-78 TaxID=1165861 RepID=A0A0L0VE06_9BASI|nr:hypothetical protein PSTG_09188 [Puccinia striiformis f. sp. tritici PST-78]
MVKLGFTPQVYKNSLYFKGHEQPDVVICQKKYIKNYRQYQSRSCIYGGDNLDIAPEVNPETLGDNKNTVFSQSESGKKPESDDAATIICPGTTGNKWWDIDQLCNQVAHKAIPIFETLHSNLQAVFVFDCSLAHRAFAKSALRVQNMNLNPGRKQSILRDTVIPKDNPHIPFHLFGQLQKFVFDDSHPLHPGKAKGVRAILKERGLWDYYTQKAWQEGQPLNLQCKDCLTTNIKKDIVRKAEELIAQVKANGYSLSEDQLVKEVLPTSQLPQETEINPTPVTDQVNNHPKMCCWSMSLSQQSEFLAKRPLLQTIIEDASHICLFLPKFHCELNPIELFWSHIKTGNKPAILCSHDQVGARKTDVN